MARYKQIEYKEGMKFSCGPPKSSGGYDSWNWCKTCTSIWNKERYRCGDCNQMTRGSAVSRTPRPPRNRARREEARRKVIIDLSKRHV